jgi:ribokinase
MTQRRTISVIGSLNTDLVTTTQRIPTGGETLTATSFSIGCGGKGANQAVACARLSRPGPLQVVPRSPQPLGQDVNVQMIGAVGSDEFGPRLVSGLAEDGIDVSRIRVVEGQTTGVAVILVEEQTGENRILLSPGANHSLHAGDFDMEGSLGVERPDLIILQLEIPLPTVITIIETARKGDIAVLLNPAPAMELPAELFRYLDHLIVNESEAAIISRREVSHAEQGSVDWGLVADEFLTRGVKNVVITLGKKGAYASKNLGGAIMIEAEKGVKVVDTTAAGDTFVGAYAVEVVRNRGSEWDLAKAVRRACKAASRTVEKEGAQIAIPWANEVEFET